VLEISSTEIKYKQYDNIDGPTFTDLIKNIESIIYKNGRKETFNTKQENTNTALPERNYVSPQSPKPAFDFEKQRLSISINIIPILINERSLFADYCYKERHSFGISVGQIYANPAFKISFSHNNYYPFAYYGFVTRLNYKYYYSKKRKQYVGAEFLYKNLSYTDKTFTVTERDTRNEYIFVRSETASIYGINILYGCHFIPLEKKCDLEMFCGVGYRHLIRNYTTISSRYTVFIPSPSSGGGPNTNQPYPASPMPIGTFQDIKDYLTITIGLKIGVDAFFRKKK
jgi:hypothetical protein